MTLLMKPAVIGGNMLGEQLGGGAEPRAFQLESGAIGPQKWQQATLKTIKLSQGIVSTSDRGVDIGKATDPLPTLRGVLAELSNEEAHTYTRGVRSVVTRLRQSFLETNDEIRSLLRAKAELEKAHEHVRKDIRVNADSMAQRTARPAREKPIDGADDMLSAERLHLLNIKRMLEAHLRLVNQQLQVLAGARKRLAAVTQERSRVLDLICNSLTPMSAQENRRQTRDVLRSSADGGLRFSVAAHEDLKSDPLGPFTPECDMALQDAKHARERGANLRSDGSDLIAKCDRLQKAAARTVNSGITQKMAETTTLKQQVELGMGENRHGTHRSQRWYDLTERAYEFSRGPLMYHDLATAERLDRPNIRVFQRHPGTQLKEAQEIVKGGDGLIESMKATSHNIGLLKIAQLRLSDDRRDKLAGLSIDGDVLRMRRRKEDHRWTMGDPL